MVVGILIAVEEYCRAWVGRHGYDPEAFMVDLLF